MNCGALDMTPPKEAAANHALGRCRAAATLMKEQTEGCHLQATVVEKVMVKNALRNLYTVQGYRAEMPCRDTVQRCRAGIAVQGYRARDGVAVRPASRRLLQPPNVGRNRFIVKHRQGGIERHGGLLLAAEAADRHRALGRFLLADHQQHRHLGQ